MIGDPPRGALADDGEHFLFRHDCIREFGRLSAMLRVGGPHGWTVEQRESLTISPAIHCRVCGTYGYFREAKWMPSSAVPSLTR